MATTNDFIFILSKKFPLCHLQQRNIYDSFWIFHFLDSVVHFEQFNTIQSMFVLYDTIVQTGF